MDKIVIKKADGGILFLAVSETDYTIWGLGRTVEEARDLVFKRALAFGYYDKEEKWRIKSINVYPIQVGGATDASEQTL